MCVIPAVGGRWKKGKDVDFVKGFFFGSVSFCGIGMALFCPMAVRHRPWAPQVFSTSCFGGVGWTEVMFLHEVREGIAQRYVIRVSGFSYYPGSEKSTAQMRYARTQICALEFRRSD